MNLKKKGTANLTVLKINLPVRSWCTEVSTLLTRESKKAERKTNINLLPCQWSRQLYTNRRNDKQYKSLTRGHIPTLSIVLYFTKLRFASSQVKVSQKLNVTANRSKYVFFMSFTFSWTLFMFGLTAALAIKSRKIIHRFTFQVSHISL